jgi:hypothetical protein
LPRVSPPDSLIAILEDTRTESPSMAASVRRMFRRLTNEYSDPERIELGWMGEWTRIDRRHAYVVRQEREAECAEGDAPVLRAWEYVDM